MQVMCEEENKETWTHIEDEFHALNSFLCCWFTTLAKDSRHAGSLFGANIG